MAELRRIRIDEAARVRDLGRGGPPGSRVAEHERSREEESPFPPSVVGTVFTWSCVLPCSRSLCPV